MTPLDPARGNTSAPVAAQARLVDRLGDELVLAGGLATSALTLTLVYLLATFSDFDLMGLYLWFVLPAGAVMTGVGAGSGYGFAAWLSDLKVPRRLLVLVFFVQVVVYFGAQYLQFRSIAPRPVFDDGTAVGFWTFFAMVTESMSYSVKDQVVAETLGRWGWGLRALEIVGFAAGGVVIPFVMRNKPYCERCRRYMRTQTLALLPASIGGKAPSKKKPDELAAFNESMTKAWEAGHALAAHALEAAQAGNAGAFTAMLAPTAATRKSTAKLPVRIDLALSACRRCHEGRLVATRLRGEGQQLKREELGTVSTPPAIAVQQRLSASA